MGEFGKLLKALRQVKEIGLREMAGLIGIAPSYLVDIEGGKRNPPAKPLLDKMIGALALDEKAAYEFYDLAAKESTRTRVPEDVQKIISEDDNFAALARRLKKSNMDAKSLLKYIDDKERR